MKTRFFALATLVLALAACNNDNKNLNVDPVAARFTADIAPATRASGTTWTGGDRIGITDIGNDTQYGNVPFILKNRKFEAEEKVIYIEDTEPHTFRAYYPYNAAGDILAATTDATAQQNQPAIDFLFATGATGDKNNPVVSFTDKTGKGGEDNSFHHRMSRITLTFEAGDGVDFSVVKPERYTLGGLILTGTFNTADGLATADNGAQAGELAMDLADGNLTSSVILFPQTVASLPLVVNCKSQEFHATLTVPEGALQAGNIYTYTITVKANSIEVTAATSLEWTPGGEETVESIVFKTDLSSAKVGDFYTSDGTLIELPEGMTLSEEVKKKIAGVVFWVPEKKDPNRQTQASLQSDKVMAQAHPNCTHGLAVSLKDVSAEMKWQKQYESESVVSFQNSDDFNPDCDKNLFKPIAAHNGPGGHINFILGYQNTLILRAYNVYCKSIGSGNKVVLPVDALDTFAADSGNQAPSNSTGWFLPSPKELHILCYKDVDDIEAKWDIDTREIVNNSLNAADGETFADNYYYWSSSEFGGFLSHAFLVNFRNADVLSVSKNYNTFRVRAVCAF